MPRSSYPRHSKSSRHRGPREYLDETVVVLDDEYVGALSRIIHDNAPVQPRSHGQNLAEEIDQVVRTFARS